MSKISDCNISENEINFEKSLRPTKLDDYVGQEILKSNLRVFIGAARSREEVLDHVLLFGPPGLGKTTLAYIIANEMKGNIKLVSGPSLERPGDLASILSSLEPGDILFIDEIHRMPRIVEEVLYSAMEDYKLNIVVSKETSSSSLSVNLPPFTLVGATTRSGDLSSPLRARFGISLKIDYYKVEELVEVVKRTANFFNTTIDNKSAKEIAIRSRGTPRIANRIFKRVRDFANFRDSNIISYSDTKRALNALGIDNMGLDDVDIMYLKTLRDRFSGGPVGLNTIAYAIGEVSTNLEEVCEPFLLMLGFIDKTAKGRVLTTKGIEHLSSLNLWLILENISIETTLFLYFLNKKIHV